MSKKNVEKMSALKPWTLKIGDIVDFLSTLSTLSMWSTVSTWPIYLFIERLGEYILQRTKKEGQERLFSDWKWKSEHEHSVEVNEKP